MPNHSKHYNKKDLKNPDVVTQELKKGFQWTRQHSKLMWLGVVIFIAGGIGFSVYQYFADLRETKAQEGYFKIEQEYLKKKEAFEKAELPPAAKKTAAKAKTQAQNKNAEQDEADSADGDKGGDPLKKATGDFEQDYGTIAKQFKELINNFPDSHAAVMAALNLSEIDFKYHREEDTLKTIEKVKLGSDLLSSMLMMTKGTAEANLKNCAQAITTWAKVLTSSGGQILAPEVHLRQALCFESLNENSKAEQTYSKIIAEDKGKALAKTAEKYLRLLKMKN